MGFGVWDPVSSPCVGFGGSKRRLSRLKPHKKAKFYKALLGGVEAEPACALKMLAGQRVDDDQDLELQLEDGGGADLSGGISRDEHTANVLPVALLNFCFRNTSG